MLVRCIFEHESRVNGCCCSYAIHGKRNGRILLLLLSAHVLKLLESLADKLHHPAQSLGLRQVDVCCLITVLHLRKLRLQVLYFLGKDNIRNTRPDTCKLRKVHVTCKSVHLLELSAGGKLCHRLQVTEVTDEIIKVVDAILLHGVSRHEKAHERPNLSGSIADRSTCSKHHIADIVLLEHGLRLQIHTLRLLGVRRVDTLHATLHGCCKAEMLVFVSLINKKCINAHIVEVLHIVGTSVKHLLGLYLGILLGYLLLLQLGCGILALGSHVAGDVCKLLLQVLDFFLGLSGYHAVATLVCILHLL